MDDSILTSSFLFAEPLSDKDISEIIHQMSDLEGVTKVNASPEELTVTYNGYLQTEEALKENLENGGYSLLDDSNQNQGWLRKFLRFIAKGNQETFKGGQPNCCNPDIPV